MTREIWSGIPGNSLSAFTGSARYWQPADSVSTFSGAASPQNIGDNYASRTRAYITAPLTGNYIFWISSDDDSVLFISTTDSKFDRVKIASLTGWTAPQTWDAKLSQKSAPVALVAGQRYFVEILHKEGGGGDHSAFAWQPPGSARTLVPASALESFTADPADLDNDELRDAWETAHGFDTTDNGTIHPEQHPFADPDLDGYSNFEESSLGINPNMRGGVPGTLLLETWSNIPGTDCAALTTAPGYYGPPTSSEFVYGAETPADRADNFGARMRGTVIAPVTGTYTFHIAGDDSCQLWLSPTESQFGSNRVASFEGWTHRAEWIKYPSQSSTEIPLIAGQRYHISAIMKEGGGGDHMEIGWKTPGSSTITIIPASTLESHAYDATDPDGDNMPSAWESAHGLDPAVNDAAADPDGDGANNVQEYASGTDPQVKSAVAGALFHELWLGVPGYWVKDLTSSLKFLQAPDFLSLASSTQTFSQPYDAFGSRLRGYITAPATGTYTFWVQGDDETELWLSGSDSKFDKQLLVRPTLNTNSFDTDLSQKSRPVSLVAGQRYYIEILHKDYYGGDFCQIAWTKPGAAREIVPGSVLESFIRVANDQDDDNLPDDWETANGLSTTDNGRINSANGANGDLDSDGLRNAEEFAAGTRADLADTDGDNVSDYDEVEMGESSALTADMAPFESIATIPGGSFAAASDTWIAENGKARQDCVRGWVEYPVTLSTAGVYQLGLTFTPVADVNSSREYEIVFSLDGKNIERRTVTVAEAATGHAKVLSPWLSVGTHTARVFVDNSRYFRRVTIDSLEILAARGSDADANGTPDWVDVRLARNNSIEAPSESLTSPVCLEGKSKWHEMTTLNGSPVLPAPDDRWYANLPLSPAQPTNITATMENGGLSATRQVNWIATNLLSTPAISIRRGDSLKLSAFTGTTGSAEETVTISVEGQTLTTTADQALVHAFNTPGDIPIQITHSQAGYLTTGTATVKVIAAPALESPVCVLGHYREVTIPALPTGVSLQLDKRIEIGGTTTYPAGSQLHILRLNTMDDRQSVIRLGGLTGPIVASQPFRAMRIRDASQTAVFYGAALDPNSWELKMPVIVDGLCPETTIRYEIFIGGVTFDDGSLIKIISLPTDGDPEGATILTFYKESDTGSICHRKQVFQGEKRIGYFQ